MNLARGLILLVLAAVVPILSLAAPKQSDTGVQIRQLEFKGNKYAVVSINLKKATLKMFWKDSNNRPFKTFQMLEKQLAKNGVKLLAAMNAGIFDKTYAPLGLHVERGQQLHKLNARTKAFGNFYMQPNGVFLLNSKGARVLSTQEFIRTSPNALEATQSGPMLVLNNKINSKFQKNSSNQLIRNGVGVQTGSSLHLVISQSWVNFYDFAAFFKDVLHCPNALYLDGNISGLYVPNSSFDSMGDYAGMIGIVQ
jgi:uncharacterized protein YigE (DUF2233 family)